MMKFNQLTTNYAAGMLLHEELPVAYNYPLEMRTGRLQHHSCVEDQYLMSEISLEEAGYNKCIDFLTSQIKGLEKHILTRAHVHDKDSLARLKKIDGIGEYFKKLERKKAEKMPDEYLRINGLLRFIPF